MIAQQRLEARLEQLTDHYKLLSDKLNLLRESYILETRIEEKMRLAKLIADAEAEREDIEQELQQIDRQMKKIENFADTIDSIDTAEPIKVFYSYAHEDEDLLNKLATHLKILERQQVIDGHSFREITPGSEWEQVINNNLEAAQIILFLVSADFIASDFCWGVEMARAMERHKAGDARVIPIILRPCNWQNTPLGRLQALPKNAKPVTSFINLDEAFADVARGIRKVADGLRKKS